MRNGSRGFDEVMIVNPYDPRRGVEGVRGMFHPSAYGPYHRPPNLGFHGYPYGAYAGLGYFALPYAEADEYGYYAEDGPYAQYGYAADDPFGYYAEDDAYAYSEADDPYGDYGEDEPYGYYAEDDPYGESDEWAQHDPMDGYPDDPYGDYAEDDPYGYYAEEDPFGESDVDDYGYYAEDDPYGEPPEMVGYGEEDYSEYDPMMEGYVRDAAPAFNAGCAVPTNVAGFGEADDELSGYVRPSTVNAECQTFTAQPGGAGRMPPTFEPLW